MCAPLMSVALHETAYLRCFVWRVRQSGAKSRQIIPRAAPLVFMRRHSMAQARSAARSTSGAMWGAGAPFCAPAGFAPVVRGDRSRCGGASGARGGSSGVAGRGGGSGGFSGIDCASAHAGKSRLASANAVIRFALTFARMVSFRPARRQLAVAVS